MNYHSAIQWLYSTQMFGIKLGLDNMRRLLRETGACSINDRKIIHVAGTNGKGSVCAMVDAIFRESDADWRSGLFTSPHLVTFRERIRVDGEMIPEAAVANTLTEIREIVEAWEQHPTFFEITLTLACRHFIDQSCDVVVLETGMGGRLDATNALQSDVSVITPVGLDHQKWLGQSIEEIAGEKAGIIKPEKPVVTSPQLPEVQRIIEAFAEEKLSSLTIVNEPVAPDWKVALAGAHQRMNAAVAVAACRQISSQLDESVLRRGLERVKWPARFQRLREGRFVVDGAHNLDAARVLAKTWTEQYPGEKATTIVGLVEGKDAESLLEIISPITDRFLFVKVNSERGREPEELAKFQPGKCYVSLSEAIAEAEKGEQRILICGSLFLAGEALSTLDGGRDFESSEQ